jgi:2-keto-4-pentenoate hydratase
MTETEIAALLLAARRNAAPVHIEVQDVAQAYAVQRLVMAELGEIGGWKVGADGPEAPPSCAPMPARHIVKAPTIFDAALFTQREVESEICFTFGASLPPRMAPYDQAEVLAAIATCQPGIELLQSRLTGPAAAARPAMLADLIQHGAFAWGAPVVTRVGNPAGDMLRLMLWLANIGAVWAGGIKAGQIVTCGSWTGKTRVPEGATAIAEFSGATPVHVSFAPS